MRGRPTVIALAAALLGGGAVQGLSRIDQRQPSNDELIASWQDEIFESFEIIGRDGLRLGRVGVLVGAAGNAVPDDARRGRRARGDC